MYDQRIPNDGGDIFLLNKLYIQILNRHENEMLYPLH